MKTLSMIKFLFVAVPSCILLLIIMESYFTYKAIKRLF